MSKDTNINFRSKNVILPLKNNLKEKNDLNHPVILIVLYQEGTVLHCYTIFFCYRLLHRTFFTILVKSISNDDLTEEWISDKAYLKKILKVTQNLRSLLNVSTKWEGG